MPGQPTSYDEVPYISVPFPQTHPDRLATTARIFGLTQPRRDRCRVLELGCASAGNLIPMAFNLPGSEFVGIDLSRHQVDDANAVIRRLGLTNIRVEHASIMDVDASWGDFDYILCHGVFSWVERDVQDRIFEIARDRMSPTGIAYISYNTYPGWHMRESVRHMMRYHAGQFEAASEQVEQARALLAFLASATGKEGPVRRAAEPRGRSPEPRLGLVSLSRASRADQHADVLPPVHRARRAGRTASICPRRR